MKIRIAALPDLSLTRDLLTNGPEAVRAPHSAPVVRRRFFKDQTEGDWYKDLALSRSVAIGS